MFLEIITPEKKLFSGEITSLKVPGTSGEFQVLKNHAPIISTLKKGRIEIKSGEGPKSIDILGGVVEVQKNKIVLLAESK